MAVMTGRDGERPGAGGTGGAARRPAGGGLMARRPWAKHVVAATAIIAFAALVGVSAPWVFPPVGWVGIGIQCPAVLPKEGKNDRSIVALSRNHDPGR